MSKKPLVIVKSSAGSGKTFAISKAYLSLILQNESPFHFQHILALTFTVKATSEMKDRIITYLSDLARGTSERKDTPFMIEALIKDTGLTKGEIASRAKIRLEALLHNYDDFSIMTIDRFFHRLVRSFSSDLSLSSDFDVQIDQNLFIDAVLDSVRSKIGSQQDLREALLDFADYQISEGKDYVLDADLKTMIRELISDHFYEHHSQDLTVSDEEVKAARTKVQKLIKDCDDDVISLGERAMNLLKSNGIEDVDLKGRTRGVYGRLQKLTIPDYSYITKSWNQYEKSLEYDTWQSDTNNPKVLEVESELSEIVRSLLEIRPQIELCKFLKSVFPGLFALSFIRKLLDIIEETKGELNIQTLSDFNRMLHSKLSEENAYFLFERLGNRYQHILIDEFQDTSVIQWNNLIPLVENSISEGNQSLIVGDGKQSIYRFRGGKTAQFSKLPSIDHPSSLLFEESAEIENLEFNYRSSKRIVDFNNRFFEALAQNGSPNLISIYDGHEQKAASSNSGSVVWQFDKAYNNKADRFDFLAKHIQHKISGGISPESITCLFFQNADARELAVRLNEMEIQVISEENLKVAAHPAVQLMLASHAVIANNKDGFLVNQWLIKLYQVTKFSVYTEVATAYQSGKSSYSEILKKLNLNYRDWTQANSSIFSQMLQITRALQLNTEDSMIQMFLDRCLEYDQQHYFKESFQSYWDRISESLSIDVPAGTKAVQLMTIHKSKGLEFDHVIVDVPDLKKSRLTQEHSWVELKEEMDLNLAYVKTRALEETRHHEVWQEEDEASTVDFTNSLYVAFTRAKTSLEIFSKPIDKVKEVGFLQTWNEWNEEKTQLVIE